MKYWGLPPFLLACLLLFPSNAFSWQGRVHHVAQGDILCISKGHKEINVRLYGVDTPETGQPYGCRARRFTEGLAGNKRVEVVPEGRDQYGRAMALVYIEGDGECLNEELVRSGYAWVHERYCGIRDCEHWRRLEREARQSEKGLWAEEDPVPPWDWRSRDRDSSDSGWQESSGGDMEWSDLDILAEAQRFYEALQLEEPYWLDANNSWEGCKSFLWCNY